MRTAKRKASEIKRLAALRDDEIDTSDIPVRADWSRAQVGRFYRPIKKQVTLRIDADVLAWFKSKGGKISDGAQCGVAGARGGQGAAQGEVTFEDDKGAYDQKDAAGFI
jgi:uncharacterized protein (DUF4415 family)